MSFIHDTVKMSVHFDDALTEENNKIAQLQKINRRQGGQFIDLNVHFVTY